jgi:hypothetical protein
VGPLPHNTLLRALELDLILHVFLAGVFTLWLARLLGLHGAPALLAATVYPLAAFAAHLQHIGAIEGFA